MNFRRRCYFETLAPFSTSCDTGRVMFTRILRQNAECAPQGAAGSPAHAGPPAGIIVEHWMWRSPTRQDPAPGSLRCEPVRGIAGRARARPKSLASPPKTSPAAIVTLCGYAGRRLSVKEKASGQVESVITLSPASGSPQRATGRRGEHDRTTVSPSPVYEPRRSSPRCP